MRSAMHLRVLAQCRQLKDCGSCSRCACTLLFAGCLGVSAGICDDNRGLCYCDPSQGGAQPVPGTAQAAEPQGASLGRPLSEYCQPQTVRPSRQGWCLAQGLIRAIGGVLGVACSALCSGHCLVMRVGLYSTRVAGTATAVTY